MGTDDNPTRVAVFIDYQNTYMGARRTFDLDSSHFVEGQVYPRRLALAVTRLGRGVDPSRQLQMVKVYRGEPSPKHSPTAQAACQRQVRFWNAQALVEGITRPLKYTPSRWEGGRVVDWDAREKGIDVLLALGMVTGALRDEFDVAVLVSSDTDLVPALEQVIEAGKRAEVAGWDGDKRNPRLTVQGRSIWCHWLDGQWYERVADRTDYTIDQGTPSSEP